MTTTVTVGDFRTGDKEREYVNEVLSTGRLSYGPFSRRFEALWAALHGVRHAVFSNSGTSALQIALQGLKELHGWQDGDEVIVPATTFVATANVVIHNRLTPVFVDVDPRTYNIDPDLIAVKVTPRTRAIMPVHLCGLPAEMDRVDHVARQYGLKVVEDSCETTFADCRGRKVGSWGDAAGFSTYVAHYIVTGVGGLTTTDNPDLAVMVRSLMNHGRDGIYLSIDDDAGLTGDRLKEVISRRFRFHHVGHSFRCTELEAALGLAQLERWQEIVAARKAVAARYSAGLSGLQDVLQLPHSPEGLEHVYMLYPLVCRRPEDKGPLTQHLEENGVETRDLLPMVNQPVYKRFGDLAAQNPVSEALTRTGFYVGCHQYITETHADHLVDVVHAYFRK